MLMYYRCRHC